MRLTKVFLVNCVLKCYSNFNEIQDSQFHSNFRKSKMLNIETNFVKYNNALRNRLRSFVRSGHLKFSTTDDLLTNIFKTKLFSSEARFTKQQPQNFYSLLLPFSVMQHRYHQLFLKLVRTCLKLLLLIFVM